MGEVLITHKVDGAPKETVLEDGTRVIRTCAFSPPGCHSVGCGLRLFIKDDKLIKVEGDPDHPLTHGRLCPRCLTLVDYVNHPDRVIYPLKRAKEDRGKDKWERISWEQAVQEISDKIHAVQADYGPECFFLLAGTGRNAVKWNYPMTAGIWGSPNMSYSQSGWSCMGPRSSIICAMLGTGYAEIDNGYGLPGGYNNPNYTLPEYILVWGKHSLESNPDGFFGHSLIEMMRRGSKLIIVDPRTPFLATRATYHAQIKCQTDTALALALMNVIIGEDLVDHEFIDQWTYGFEELKEHVKQFTPEWAAKECDIPVKIIYEIARALGTCQHWGLNMGLAVDQNPNGSQCCQCLLSLVAMTGQLDSPGGTLIGETNAQDFGTKHSAKSQISLPPEVAEKCIGQKEYPLLGLMLNTVHPDLFLETLVTDKPYPLKAGWIHSTNLITATCSAQPKQWHDALQRMDIMVVQDLWMTPTAMACADYFLPLAAVGETEGNVFTMQGQQQGIIGALNKAHTVGECKSDNEIGLLFAHHNQRPAFESYQKVSDWINRDLVRYDLTYDELSEQVVRLHEIPYHKYEIGLCRPDREPGFNTPTTKFEFYATLFEAYGEQPLPYYVKPALLADMRPDLASEYPLTMTTGQKSYTYFHSENRQIKKLREIKPYAQVEIHPATAAIYSIEEGDWVVIENPWGKAVLKAHLTPIIRRDTVAAEHGWWYPEDKEDGYDFGNPWEANINTMIPHKIIGPLGFGAPYKGTPCKIYKSDMAPIHNWKSLG